MQCEALKHAPLTCEGFRGFKKGDKGTAFVSAMQLRACEAKFKSHCLPFEKKNLKNKVCIFKNSNLFFANFKISFTRKSWLLILGLAKLVTKIRAEITRS